MSCTEFLRRNREVAGLGADAVAEIAALIFGVRVDRQFRRVELEAGVVGRGLEAHVVEHEEFGFRSEENGVADAHRLDHGLGLLGHAARVAVVGLAGGRLQHVAGDDHGGLREERIDRRGDGSGIRHMSDSLIAFQPAIDEPSNIRPSAKVSSSIMPTSNVTCCHLPRGSVKRRSTYLTSLSLIDFRTSLAVFMNTPFGLQVVRDLAAAAAAR